MARNDCPANVELRIPCKPEFVGVARLTILGVANRMGFSYYEIEDIRMAVSEACTASVEWAERNGKRESEILLRSAIGPDKLTLDILDDAGARSEDGCAAEAEPDAENLGALFIRLLVDEVTVSPTDGGTHVRMVKYAGQR